VFMLGEQVKVASLRYGADHGTCKVLEFVNGLKQRPLLRKPRDEERLKRQGTRVSVKLKETALEALQGIKKPGVIVKAMGGVRLSESETFSIGEVVAALVPALDIDVRFIKDSTSIVCIQANDWQDISADSILLRIQPIVHLSHYAVKGLSDLLLPIQSDHGTLLGRCALSTNWNSGMLVVNGISAGEIKGIVGILHAQRNLDLARTKATPIACAKEMRDWANQQCQEFRKQGFQHFSLQVTANALALGGDVADWPLVSTLERQLDREELRKYVDHVGIFGLFKIWMIMIRMMIRIFCCQNSRKVFR
jgi:hypothetical protein